MASSIIHICIAKEINKVFKRKEKDILIGSIAPDIAKHIGKTKAESHFQADSDNIPNLDLFLKKYKNDLNDDFVLGYYIHLYTDYLWFKYFIPNFIKNDFVYNLNEEKVFLSDEEKNKYIYNDYTNLNIRLIDYYNLDLSVFYEEIPKLNNIIKEIPMDKISIIVEKTGIIIENSKRHKPFIFDIKEVNKFIDLSISVILDNLKTVSIT